MHGVLFQQCMLLLDGRLPVMQTGRDNGSPSSSMLVYVGGLHCGLSWCDLCQSCGSTTKPQLQAGRHHASSAIHVSTCKHIDLPF